MDGIIRGYAPKPVYDVCAKLRFGYEEPSLVPYTITKDSANSSNGPKTTPENPGLIKIETMSCLATTRAFYGTKITHDSGSTEDRESGTITPASSRLMVLLL